MGFILVTKFNLFNLLDFDDVKIKKIQNKASQLISL